MPEMIVPDILRRAEFQAAKMGKVTLAAGNHLFAGLNCFEPGQAHEAHVHADQDKMYYVLEGLGEVTVGDQVQGLATGDLAFAPAGVPHGIRNTGNGKLIVLTVFAPPPGYSKGPS